jgi:hypothetical protein
MALNRLTEVRLNLNKFGQNTDTGEIDFGNRTWHYDTRYFDTNVTSMKRVVVRVYAGDAKTKGNPVAESIGFLGTSLGIPGGSNVDWTAGSTLASAPGSNPGGTAPGTTTPGTAPPGTPTPGNTAPGTTPPVAPVSGPPPTIGPTPYAAPTSP